jgi:hypothetical protein
MRYCIVHGEVQLTVDSGRVISADMTVHVVYMFDTRYCCWSQILVLNAETDMFGRSIAVQCDLAVTGNI